MIVMALKFVHIAAIALWAAGLICFPFLNRQRNDVGHDADLHRLHSMVRFFYVVILSPAAFVAIGTGTALIFQQQTFTAWFSLKLLLVGVLAAIHLFTGRFVLRLFDKEKRMSSWTYATVTTMTVAVVTAIVTVVLMKPQFDLPAADTELFEPGNLGKRIDDLRGAALLDDIHSLPRIDHQSDTVVEDQLAAVPTGQAREDGGEYRQGETMRQHFLGELQPQPPIRTGDREQCHSGNRVRPATHSIADACNHEQFGRAHEGGGYAQPKREAGTPDTGTQEERIAEVPIENIDSQRGKH